MPNSKPSFATIFENVDKNHKIFELSPEAIIILDGKGSIIEANQRLEDWLGYSPKDAIGKNISAVPFLSGKSKLLAMAQFTKRMAGQKIAPYELEFTAKDKSKIIGLVQAKLIKDKKGKGIADLVMISDITERKKGENQLLASSKELERLNKLMIGREYKMAELKRKLKDGQSQSQGKQGGAQEEQDEIQIEKSEELTSTPPITSIKAMKIAIAIGAYVNLIVILFSTLEPSSAIVFVGFVTFLGLAIIWMFTSFRRDLLVWGKGKIKDHGETRGAMLNLLEDIAEEKAYEEMRGKSILENIGEGIVITNEKGLVKYMNPALEKFLGCLTDEIKDKDFAETVKMFDLKGQEIPVYKRSDSAAVTAKNQEMKALVKCAEGKQMVIQLNAAPINVDNQFRGVVRVVHDISEEFELQQQKDDFFSIASHELRTPLTVIAGNIDMIIQGYGKSQLKKDDRLLLVDAATATDRLINMVNEFLNVSRLDQGRLKANIEEIDVCKLTEEVVKEISPLAKTKKITLEYSCLKDHGKVRADENLVKEILINLIGNSIKFTQKGGIKVGHVVENDWLITTVSDTGIGIDEDKQAGLFARFQQAMSRTMSREAGGTGLGLYISREFAQLMGGDLNLISSQKGKGSTFAFKLPLLSNTTIIVPKEK